MGSMVFGGLKSRLAALPVLAVALLLSACSGQNFDLPNETLSFSEGVKINNKVDILFMIDNSTSMLQYQNKFALQVSDMIAKLNEIGLDYQIGVTTSDMRSGGNGGILLGNPRFVRNSTPNLVETLKTRITVGQNGSDLERGLQAIGSVLSPSYLSGDGLGFQRDDALLVIIFLSNEDDYSSGTTASYIDSLNRLKPALEGSEDKGTLGYGKQPGWIANFIGVLSIDADCNTTADFKEAGLRYMALVEASGGRNESICRSSLAQAVSNIRGRIIEVMTDYHLGRKPLLETLKVYKNGIEVKADPNNGYTYHEDGNFVRFRGTAIPKANDQIVVDFKPAEAT